MVVMEKTFGDTCKPNRRTVELDSGDLTFMFDDEPETDKNISIDVDVQKCQIAPKCSDMLGVWKESGCTEDNLLYLKNTCETVERSRS